MAKHHSTGSSNKIPSKVLAQREEAERIARDRAERLFTPAEATPTPATPKAEAQGEPSLEQRLADIDRRAKQRAMEEKSALASHYLGEARRTFVRAIANTTDADLKKAHDEVQRLERLVGDGASTGVTTGSSEQPTTRVRRSSEDLQGDAEKLAAWLRDHPDSKGSAAQAGAGVTVKAPLNVRTFLEKYLPGTKVTTHGEKAGTTYSVK